MKSASSKRKPRRSPRACTYFSACVAVLFVPQQPAGAKDPEVQVKIGEPIVTPDKEERAQVEVRWPLQVPCSCELLKVRQEIKGYVELIDQSNAKNKKTARDIVRGKIDKITPGKNKEVDDFRKDAANNPDTSEKDFIPDIGKHGTSSYPKDLLKCEDLEGGSAKVELRDEPGTTARAGKDKPWKSISIRLVLRDTILCNDKVLFSFIWHLNYDLPPAGKKPDVKMGE